MFRAIAPVATGANPVSSATADLDGDGHLDLLVTNYITDNVSVLFGNGNGTFTAGTPVPVGNGPREVAVGFIDGDGDLARFPNQVRHRLCPGSPWEQDTVISRLMRDAAYAA